MINKLKIIAIVFATILFTSCKKNNADVAPTPVPVVTNTIAYIFKTDNADGLAYKALLDANNCAVTLIEKANIIATDYSKYKLIVIDHNTDVIGIPQFWTATEVSTLNATGKPMLLIGAGGLQFAQKNNNIVNWGQATQWNEPSIIVTDPTSIIFSKPKAISVDANTKKVVLYTSAGLMAAHHVPTLTIANVSIIGRTFVNNNYAPIEYESNRYGFFEFYSGVNSMTQAGKDFMVNYTFFVGNFPL